MLLGSSPHGARPKVLVQYDENSGVVSTSESATGTPWLFKFPRGDEHKEVCAIECLYLEMARQCNLDVPATRYFDLGPKTAAFGIERFDRFNGMRVPIYTLAGALNTDFRVPNTSYDTLLRTTRALTLSEVEVLKAYEHCVFNVVFNNRDDHTKNFSFRMDESFAWNLSPCYDLTYCPGPGGYHQMDVEGEALSPTKSHLLKLASSNGIRASQAQAIVDRFVTVACQFKNVAKDYPIRKTTVSEIARAITANCNRMAS